MKQTKWKFLFLMICSFLIGCKKGELPVTPPNNGDLVTNSVDMSSNYAYQVYFDLSSNSNKGSNLKTNWDLGISCKLGSSEVILNTSKLMFAAAILDRTFDQIVDTTGFGTSKITDESNGQSDKLALFGHSLFIIDKGMNELGIHLGFFKLEIIENSATEFKAKFANVDGTNEELVTLQKNDAYNFLFVNWSNGLSTVVVEPPKSEWDLVFTQYVHIFYEPEFTPYLVTGCLTNSHETKAIEVVDKAFEEINLGYAESQFFTNDRDVLGYDWKLFDGSNYTINPDKIFIIKDEEGFYYKLRFIDFYNESGEKGNPTFEFLRL